MRIEDQSDKRPWITECPRVLPAIRHADNKQVRVSFRSFQSRVIHRAFY